MSEDVERVDDDMGDAGDPARAFEALRRTIEATGRTLDGEMTVIRKDMAALFEVFDKRPPPPDYGRDLGLALSLECARRFLPVHCRLEHQRSSTIGMLTAVQKRANLVPRIAER